ncbi:hypothetical protein K458DRAFT_412015 [Lentithecium fluviatile CBS 122367]|uniref:Uncharacterized protein n=1 Tax=Lentithecium fluviatile CBS 122367 TaxID=1168545 RepID=A0A6G1JKH8_9PLEO|nr:hypothetical protein K458DRAFT_412015 [Lentithecium fluviatile CBS 122367]
MALAFNIPGVGPLAQVSIGPGELMAAYQIATGAYGWWKARERTESLVHLLSSSRCSLSAPSSFNHRAYAQVRTNHGKMQGIVVQDNTVCSIPLPRASTALPSDRGQACLRALTAAILCFYKTEAAAEMLREIIPLALLHRELDDLDVDFKDGPLVLALKHWVASVAVEEDSDLARDYLLRQVALNEHNLTGVPIADIMNLDLGEQQGEIPFVMGVIKWSLTPSPQRKFSRYATRSVRAWSMASILFKLGFDVTPAPYIASSREEYDLARLAEGPEVCLVACAGTDTDYLACSVYIGDDDQVRPYITPLSGVPVLAFRHQSGKPFDMNISKLQEAFEKSFVKSREVYKRLTWPFVRQFTHLDPQEYYILPDKKDFSRMPQLHKQLFSIFAIFGLFCPAMSEYVPSDPIDDVSWTPGLIKACLRNEVLNQSGIAPHGAVLYNAYLLVAIVMGTFYGICSNLIIWSQENGQILQEDICFVPPENLHGNWRRLERWLNQINPRSRTKVGDQPGPQSVLSEMFLGFPGYVDRFTVDSLGLHINGHTLLSELVVHPTIDTTVGARYHLLRGQPLNVPTNRYGIISVADFPSKSVNTHARQPVSKLKANDTVEIGDIIRIDAEPCWTDDPETIVWKARRNGLTLGQLNLGHRFLGKENNWNSSPRITRQSCKCASPVASIPVRPNLDKKWYEITIGELFAAAPDCLELPEGSARYFIDACASEATTTFAACRITGYAHMEFVWDCFKCALDKLEKDMNVIPDWLKRNRRPALLIVAWTFRDREAK